MGSGFRAAQKLPTRRTVLHVKTRGNGAGLVLLEFLGEKEQAEMRRHRTTRSWCGLVTGVAVSVAAMTLPPAMANPVGPAIETLTVPATNPIGVDSSTVLVSGQTYWILAQGTYRHSAAGAYADAKWGENGPFPWLEETSSPNEHDMLINHSGVDWLGSSTATIDPVAQFSMFAPHVFSGIFPLDPLNPINTHWYWQSVVGSGATLNLSIQDHEYSDNSGFLTAQIYVPEPTTMMLLLTGAGWVAARRRR